MIIQHKTSKTYKDQYNRVKCRETGSVMLVQNGYKAHNALFYMDIFYIP